MKRGWAWPGELRRAGCTRVAADQELALGVAEDQVRQHLYSPESRKPVRVIDRRKPGA